jgi:hypothetical protein
MLEIEPCQDTIAMKQPYDQADLDALEALVELGLIRLITANDSSEPSYVFEPSNGHEQHKLFLGFLLFQEDNSRLRVDGFEVKGRAIGSP